MSPPNRTLIVGACGLIGTHLIDYYHHQNRPVIGTFFRPTKLYEETKEKAELIHCDVRDQAAVAAIISATQPQVIYHLAAQSLPTLSWEKPAATFEVNVNGTIHLFEAIKALKAVIPKYNPVVVVACSSAEYGASLNPENSPVHEQIELLPLHPYGVSKVAQDLLAYQYWVGFGIRTVRARIFNTTGPRQQIGVVAEFTKRAVAIEKGELPPLRVGNLEVERTITDVRDVVHALHLLSEKGQPGEAYNVCGEKSYPMIDIIEAIRKEIQLPFEIWQDPALFRPADEAILIGDNRKLKAATQWVQTYSLHQTITDMLNYWRNEP